MLNGGGAETFIGKTKQSQWKSMKIEWSNDGSEVKLQGI